VADEFMSLQAMKTVAERPTAVTEDTTGEGGAFEIGIGQIEIRIEEIDHVVKRLEKEGHNIAALLLAVKIPYRFLFCITNEFYRRS